jgi:hypothetical protein
VARPIAGEPGLAGHVAAGAETVGPDNGSIPPDGAGTGGADTGEADTGGPDTGGADVPVPAIVIWIPPAHRSLARRSR